MIKIKEGFVLRDIAGQKVAVATGKVTKDFHGMIKLNSTGCFLWEKLSCGIEKEALISALTEAYDVDANEAEADVNSFLEVLKNAGIIED